MRTIREQISSEVEWAQSGQWSTEQSVNRMLYLVRAEVIRNLPNREWDENDADSCEARAARAYNSALADVHTLFQEKAV